MTIYTCDKCNQQTQNLFNTFRIGQFLGVNNYVSLCKDCFLPYMKLLEKDKIARQGLMDIFETAQSLNKS